MSVDGGEVEENHVGYFNWLLGEWQQYKAARNGELMKTVVLS